MRFSSSLLVVLVLPLLVGCNGTEEVGTEERGTEEVGPDVVLKEIGVIARLENGQIKIDTTHHETVVVKPGDEIAWVCRECPAGTEFAVEGLHLVANIEQIVDVLSEPPPAGSQASASGEGDTREPYIDGEIGLQWSNGELVVTRNPAGPEPVWAPPDNSFKATGERIVSRVGNVPHGVYKFTWKVRLAGKPESEVGWDPHIYTHPGY